jgi:mannitol-specific phosphotransferase system IIBC component
MEDSKMKKHVTVVGAIHIGFGILGLIGAIAVFFALNFAKGFVDNEEIPTLVLGFLSLSLPLLIGFMSTLGLVVSGF